MNAAARIECAPPAGQPISVLIIDDSAVARAALSQMVERSATLMLAGVADGAEAAIVALTQRPVDVILLDLEMPGWTGLAALPKLLAAGRGAKVLVVSSTARAGAEASLQALAAGAADTLAKPETGQLNQNFQSILVERIERLGCADRQDRTVEHFALRSEPATPIALLAIGASTGGLSALAAFFSALPRSFTAPIVVTQHLPPGFMPYFADQLSAMAGRFANLAEEGRIIESGEITIAPGPKHLRVVQAGHHLVAKLTDERTETRCFPSLDPMLESVAEVAGVRGVGIILTGMGRDGTIGATRIVEAGGSVLVQDRLSSAVWGMPGSVARAGLACVAATPTALAGHIARRGTA